MDFVRRLYGANCLMGGREVSLRRKDWDAGRRANCARRAGFEIADSFLLPADSAVAAVLKEDTTFRKLLSYFVGALEIALLACFLSLRDQRFDLLGTDLCTTGSETYGLKLRLIVVFEYR